VASSAVSAATSKASQAVSSGTSAASSAAATVSGNAGAQDVILPGIGVAAGALVALIGLL
jgi:hypothetical protein